MVYNCVFWLNSYPHRDGVHATISPRTIMTGKIKFDKNCRVEFGTYVKVNENTQQLNVTKNIRRYSP